MRSGGRLYAADTNQNLVGTIEGPNGDVDIIVERLNRSTLIPLWLLSSKTLRLIPDLYAEVNRTAVETAIPRCSTETSIAAIRVPSWIAVLHGLTLLYGLTSLLRRALRWLMRPLVRFARRDSTATVPDLLPRPLRLLLMAAVIQGALTKFTLPLLAPHFRSSTAAVLTISGCVWLAIQLNALAEGYFYRRLDRRNTSGAVPILWVIRRPPTW